MVHYIRIMAWLVLALYMYVVLTLDTVWARCDAIDCDGRWGPKPGEDDGPLENCSLSTCHGFLDLTFGTVGGTGCDRDWYCGR